MAAPHWDSKRYFITDTHQLCLLQYRLSLVTPLSTSSVVFVIFSCFNQRILQWRLMKSCIHVPFVALCTVSRHDLIMFFLIMCWLTIAHITDFGLQSRLTGVITPITEFYKLFGVSGFTDEVSKLPIVLHRVTMRRTLDAINDGWNVHHIVSEHRYD